jgi:hypothetical protein
MVSGWYGCDTLAAAAAADDAAPPRGARLYNSRANAVALSLVGTPLSANWPTNASADLAFFAALIKSIKRDKQTNKCSQRLVGRREAKNVPKASKNSARLLSE